MDNKDSWTWLENINISQRTIGILLIVVPSIILIILGGYWYVDSLFTNTMASITINVTNPPTGFIDSTAQILAGLGLCLASIFWGMAKIIKSLK